MGCGNFVGMGHDFNVNNAHYLKPGISTEEDAQKLLGKPTSVQPAAAANPKLDEWTYAYYSIGASKVKHVAVSFDDKGRMIKIVAESDGN